MITIGTVDVLQACDACADMGMTYSVIVQCTDCIVFPQRHTCVCVCVDNLPRVVTWNSPARNWTRYMPPHMLPQHGTRWNVRKKCMTTVRLVHNLAQSCYVVIKQLSVCPPVFLPCPLPGKKTCCHGPGYASPLDAVQNGPRETLIYVTCARRNVTPGKPDFLATVDVDPKSATYSQVRH